MAFTIEDALKLKDLEDCTLIAGSNGVKRKITCIDTMEVPDIYPWLKKDELLVTTGYSIKEDGTGDLLKLVEALKKSGSAGIMIKTRFIGAISDEVLRRADELGIPVIRLPDNKPFIEILNAVMKVIVNEQNRLIDYSEKIREKFFDMEIREGGLQNIGGILYDFLKKPIIILDNYDKTVFSFPDSFYLNDIDKGKYLSVIRMLFTEGIRSSETIYEKDKSFFIKPSMIHGNTYGYIIVELSGSEELEETDMITLDHADTIMALEFSNREMSYHKRYIMDTNLLMDIIMNNIKNDEEAYIRANYLRWQKPPFFIAVININSFGTYAKKNDERENLFTKHEIDAFIKDYCIKKGMECTVINESDNFLCILKSSYEDRFSDVAEGIYNHINNRYKLLVTIGVSETIERYIDIKNAYKDAMDAIKIGRRLNSYLVFIKDYGLEQAVLNSSDTEYLKKFVDQSIGKLKKYDEENNTVLFDTLKILIKNMGIRTKTAKELYLHRNTLFYRIKKIESILDCSLDREEKLIELGAAIRLYEVM